MRWLRQILVLMLVGRAAHAQDVLALYNTPELEEIGARYRPNVMGMWEQDFLGRLTREERRRGGAVTLRIPLVGVHRHPLEFYSSSSERLVFLPIASIKFLDDISVAFAYYDAKGCDLGIVSDYVATLRFRPQDVAGSPLDALGVPRAALQDPKIDGVAQTMLKSIMFFITAHEYAHVMYRHRSYQTITAQEAQQQEAEADAFARDVMRRISAPPIALAFFFLIASRIEATPGDFATAVEYERYLRDTATHPVNAQRLSSIAESIEQEIETYSRLQQNPVAWAIALRKAALQLRDVARTLDDRRMRDFLANRVRQANMASFRLACRR